jgi:DNA modification methylase
MSISSFQVKGYFKNLLSIDLPFLSCAGKRVVCEDGNRVLFSDGSIYHKDNKLNDLTNKEWVKFQKSWFIFKPTRKREKDTIDHPAIFPDELVADFIKFFTKKGAVVLDPMVGIGSTLIACVETGRNGIGIDLNEKYALIAKRRLLRRASSRYLFNGERVHIDLFVGDAMDIDKLDLPKVDYCITSPPYWNMLREKGFETQSRRREMGLDVYYSDDERDLGNIPDYNEFLDKLVQIYKKVYDILKPNCYMTIIVKNVKKKNKMYPLAWDLANRLSSFFCLKDEKIWCQDIIKLAPYGYKNAWVSNTVHHYCLNFKKE